MLFKHFKAKNFSEAIYYGLSVRERFISIYLFLYFLINYILFSIYLERFSLQIYVMLLRLLLSGTPQWMCLAQVIVIHKSRLIHRV